MVSKLRRYSYSITYLLLLKWFYFLPSVPSQAFGQRQPPLYVAIQKILDKYPDGQIFKVQLYCIILYDIITRMHAIIIIIIGNSDCMFIAVLKGYIYHLPYLKNTKQY